MVEMRCLVLQPFQSHKQIFNEKILAQSPELVFKDGARKILLTPRAIQTCSKIIGLKTSILSSLLFCEKQTLNLPNLGSSENLDIKFDLNYL